MQEITKRVALYQQKDNDEQEKGQNILEEQSRIYTVEEPSLPSTSQEAGLSTGLLPWLQVSSNVEKLHNMRAFASRYITHQGDNQAKAMKILE